MESVESLESPHGFRPVRVAGTFAAITCIVLAATLPPPAAAAPAKRNWQTWETPEAAGFSSERLAEAERMWYAVDDAPLAAFFVVYKGKVLASFGDVAADHQCHSVRKSFLSALYGIHEAKGTIDLESTLEELGIDDRIPLTDAEKQARVVDLLKARSGVYIEAACEAPEMKEARPARGAHAPGTFWYYNNWDFNALGTIFRNETGHDIFRDFKTKIAQPIGMQDFNVARCSYTFERDLSNHPCYVFRMSARDRARFGQLFLQGGRWGKKQVVPEAWVDESTRGYSRTSGITGDPGVYYGYMWWVTKKQFFRSLSSERDLRHLTGFAASGYRGQLIMVLPDPEMVIVTATDVPAGGNLEGEEWGPIVETILTAREIVDLKITQASCLEQIVSPGEDLDLKAKIKNLSATETLATTVGFYLTEAGSPGEEIWHLGAAAVTELAPKRSRTVRLTAPLPSDLAPGRYRLIGSVDDDKTNYDLHRQNNLKIVRRVIEVR